ncbi:glycosyltransferase family 4 protein [Campylobacter concisus]|uniref:glycosyltransferase family 4 protein n=1 Tax=Campylobacter concisus TaxID=199 RepID=UPI000CD981FA|nr:glycosyltransferase family 1 protein [Campylobacter concisus]
MLIVNARFLTQNITGVQRYAIEISKQLKIQLGNEVLFVSPKNIIHNKIAEELEVCVVGKNRGHIWEQFDLPIYLTKNKSPLLLNLANTAPICYGNNIVTLHDIAFERFSENFNWKFGIFYRLLIPRIAKKAIKIITVSEFSKQEICDFYKIPSQKIYVIYNAVSNIFNQKVKNYSEKYVLAVSSLNYQKNFHSLIRAFNMLDDNNIKLFLVGDINRNFADIGLLKDIQGNKNIVFKGRIDDDELISLYSNAVCFIYPSLYEGFGIPPLEAQACGCPVVCSNAASLPEVCGDSVIYFDPYSVKDMRDKILSVLNDEILQKELRTKGFNNIKRFSWKRSVEQVIEILRSLE